MYQHLLSTVKIERDESVLRSGTKDAIEYAARWWTFCKPRQEMRSFLKGLGRSVVTVQTAKHRVFTFLDTKLMADQKLIVFGFDDSLLLGILSSRIHLLWSEKVGALLEDRPVYVKSLGFDPFPFPDPDERLKAEIADIAEKLDAHRKSVQAAHPDITLTEMYNVLEKLRQSPPSPALPTRGRVPAGEVGGMRDKSTGATPSPSVGRAGEGAAELTERELDIKSRGLILILQDYHDELDAAVFRAYGWPRDLTDEQILERLVALNKERAAEEATGKVRWLRPDYQIPRFGSATQKAERGELDLVAPEAGTKPSFPTDERRRTSAIYSILAAATAPLSAADIAARFRQGKKIERDIALTLRAYVRFGDVATPDAGRTFELRRAA